VGSDDIGLLGGLAAFAGIHKGGGKVSAMAGQRAGEDADGRALAGRAILGHLTVVELAAGLVDDGRKTGFGSELAGMRIGGPFWPL